MTEEYQDCFEQALAAWALESAGVRHISRLFNGQAETAAREVGDFMRRKAS